MTCPAIISRYENPEKRYERFKLLHVDQERSGHAVMKALGICERTYYRYVKRYKEETALGVVKDKKPELKSGNRGTGLPA